jgi:hypothetical protein
MNNPSGSLTSRRDFLKTSAIVGTALAAPAILPSGVYGASSDTLKVGLIGCGGRGSGAADNALRADKNAVLTAMADAFEAPLQSSLQNLQKHHPEQVKVSRDKCFVGLDAFQKVIDSGVDVVLLCTPPGFRPQHLKAAIASGKNVFLREADGHRFTWAALRFGVGESRQGKEPGAGGRLLLAL